VGEGLQNHCRGKIERAQRQGRRDEEPYAFVECHVLDAARKNDLRLLKERLILRREPRRTTAMIKSSLREREV
jgi:hypothetical protein